MPTHLTSRPARDAGWPLSWSREVVEMSVARRAMIGFMVVFLVAVSSCAVVFAEARNAGRRLAG
jgi:hypothetical protein